MQHQCHRTYSLIVRSKCIKRKSPALWRGACRWHSMCSKDSVMSSPHEHDTDAHLYPCRLLRWFEFLLLAQSPLFYLLQILHEDFYVMQDIVGQGLYQLRAGVG